MGKIEEQVGTCSECGCETDIDSPLVCFGCVSRINAGRGVFTTKGTEMKRIIATAQGTFTVSETRTGAIWVRGPQEYQRPMKAVWRDGDWQDHEGTAGFYGHFGPRVARFFRGANEALARFRDITDEGQEVNIAQSDETGEVPF